MHSKGRTHGRTRVCHRRQRICREGRGRGTDRGGVAGGGAGTQGKPSRPESAWPSEVRLVYGDLLDPGPVESGIFQADAVIHLVGIIAENRSRNITFERIHVQGTRAVVEVAKRAGVKRFIQMSAIGAGRMPSAPTTKPNLPPSKSSAIATSTRRSFGLR